MPSYSAPSRLILGSLTDERGRFDTYWSRLAEVDVKTPETRLFPVDESDRDSWPVTDIVDWMNQQEWSQAFVRGMDKAAPQRLEAGSIIDEPTEAEVTNTIESLIVQLADSPWTLGGKVAVRELIDTDFCMNSNHTMCHPEVRFFIEDSDILSQTPASVTSDVCAQQYNYLSEMLETAEPPRDAAERVAEAFPEYTWGVDFALDTQGEWYCVELNFNGIRWDDENEEWINICGHGDVEAYSPRVIHDPAIRRAMTMSTQ